MNYANTLISKYESRKCKFYVMHSHDMADPVYIRNVFGIGYTFGEYIRHIICIIINTDY